MPRYLTFMKMDESMPWGPPPPALFAAMDDLVTREIKDGTMVDSGGLLPSATGGTRVVVKDGKLTIHDGPFAESKEVVGGWAMFELRNKAEAIEKAREFMQLHIDTWPGFEGTSEVREVAGDDFDPSTLGGGDSA